VNHITHETGDTSNTHMVLVADRPSGTYRAVYAAKLAKTLYVLHVFRKKARRGIATPKRELDLIKARLRWAGQRVRSAMEE
jgi:phage-related protein